jgi:hypothetical protein
MKKKLRAKCTLSEGKGARDKKGQQHSSKKTATDKNKSKVRGKSSWQGGECDFGLPLPTAIAGGGALELVTSFLEFSCTL